MKGPPVYKDEKDAILALVRIFGPCHLSEILGELRMLFKAGLIEVVPYSWAVAKQGYVKHEVVDVLNGLWMAGQILELEGPKYKAY